MPNRIHLIEHLGLMHRVDGNIFDSGYWKITPQQAEELIGCDIYFHKKQKELSFFGGKILGYRIFDKDDELKGRIIFRFEYLRSHKGVSAGDGGWSYEKKII
jgi:hypothetical protein